MRHSLIIKLFLVQFSKKSKSVSNMVCYALITLVENLATKKFWLHFSVHQYNSGVGIDLNYNGICNLGLNLI